jgi:lipase chaperone LimK
VMVAAALAGLGTAGWLIKGRQNADANLAQKEPGAGASGWGMIDASKDGAAATDAGAPRSALTPDQVRNKLFKEGSFAGTEPTGGWCVQAGQLKPCPDLRKRFEYYILGLGEVTIEDIKLLVADEARRANGAQQADAIMAIWDKYWQLRTYNWRNKFDQSDRASWMPVFEEQRAVRRQILGADWAHAFFDEDEAHFKQYYAQIESGQAPPVDPGEPVPQMGPGKDAAAVQAERVARYGEAAAGRLAKADEEWADWERRLAAARTEWARLQSAPNLSDAQRKADMDTYVKANFKPDEFVRVRALLHL